MGRLSFALLTLMFVKLMAEADVFQSKENNYREESPCIAWKCGGKRAVQLDQEESKRMNKIQPSDARRIASAGIVREKCCCEVGS